MSTPGRTSGGYPLHWHGHRWVLLPTRALWWEARQTLVVADLHLGKEALFQARGLPVPEGAGLADLKRLGDLVVRLKAQEVLILGDLVHGHGVWDTRLLTALDQALPPRRTLVPGNHDPAQAPVPTDLGFALLEEGSVVDGVALRHTPSTSAAPIPELAGHIHPVYRLRGRGDTLRLPCFAVSSHRMILPAFGSFTGGENLVPSNDTALYLAVHEEDGEGVLTEGLVSPVPHRGR